MQADAVACSRSTGSVLTVRRKLPLLVESTTVHSHDPADPDWTEAAVPDDWLWLVLTCRLLTLAPRPASPSPGA